MKSLPTNVKRKISDLVRAKNFGLIIVVGAFLLSSITNTSQARQACERGKLDRIANAHGWGIAQATRKRTSENEFGTQQKIDAGASDEYGGIVSDLGSRSGDNLNCKKHFKYFGVISL